MHECLKHVECTPFQFFDVGQWLPDPTDTLFKQCYHFTVITPNFLQIHTFLEKRYLSHTKYLQNVCKL